MSPHRQHRHEVAYMSTVQEVYRALGLASEDERRKYRGLAGLSAEEARPAILTKTTNTSEPKAELAGQDAELERYPK